MPAAAPGYAQFLAPQRAGEEVPGSQIQTQGPFSAELTQPAFIAPNVKPTGYGGAGQAMLHFANQFLAGASEGRLRQFQQSERTKKEHENSYDAAVQHVQDGPFTKKFKDDTINEALLNKASAGKAALGKPGKDSHSLVHVANNLFDHVIGPSENKKHVDIGPEHIADLVAKMRDPANRFDIGGASAQAGAGVGAIIKELQDAAKANGTGQLYQEDVPGHPKFAGAVSSLTSEGLNPLTNEGVSSRLSVLPHRPSAEAVAKSKMPVKWIWRDEQGNLNPTSVRISTEGQVQDLSGVAIPIDSPIIKNGGIAGQFDVASQRVAGLKDVQGLKNTGAANVANIRNQPVYKLNTDAQGNLHRTQVSGFHDLIPPIGAPTPPPPIAGAAAADTAQPQASADGTFDIPGYVGNMAQKHGIDPALAQAVAGAESANNPDAVSPKGAQGVMQLMPDTAKQYGVTNPMDPGQNIEAGVRYLKDLLVKYNGDEQKALAAYNAGPGRVDGGKELPEETTKYIAQVTKDRQAIANTNATKESGTKLPTTIAANPREGIVGTGFNKPTANSPISWTPEQNKLASAPLAPGQRRRDEFMQTWPLQDQLDMKMIADYQYKLPGGTKGAITSPLVRSYMAAVKAYNPSFDASKYDKRAALSKDAEYGGKIYTNNSSLNTALVHLGGLDEAAGTLDNAAFKPYNTFANWMVKNAGSDQVKPFETYRTAFNAEMARALKGGVADKSEIDDWKHNIDTSDSPKALKSAFKSVANIIAGRIGEQEANFERGMGEPPEKPFISPKAQAVLTRLGGNGTPGAPNPNPSGFVVGHRYRNMEYLGGDPNSATSWKQ